MQNHIEFPLDLLGYIADMLGANVQRSKQWSTIDWDSFDTLKMLSLTCQFMLPVCRRHLFSIIRLPCSRRAPLIRQEGLSEFLLAHPTIKPHYFKNLYLDNVWECKLFSTADYAILNSICNSSSLSLLEVSSPYLCDWNGCLTEEAKSAIFSLIQMPTLRYLTISHVEHFPATLLSRCLGLKELALHGISTLTPLGADDAMQANTITTLVSLTSLRSYYSQFTSGISTLAVLMSPIGRNTAEQTRSLTTFDRLTNFSTAISTQVEFLQICKFLETTISLERLHLYVDCSWVQLAGLGSSLATPPRSKLRSVILDFSYTHVRDSNPLPDLSPELKHLSGKNDIELLEVEVTGWPDTLWGPGSSDWAADFDRLVTDRDAFPVLSQVNINLCLEDAVDRRFGDADELWDWEIIDAWFPRLSESTAIQFELGHD